MRFMALWHPAKVAYPPTQKDFENMGKLIGDMMKEEVLIDTGGWDPNSPSTIIERSGDKITVTDGPYAEAKETIGGFAIFNVKSKEEMLKWSKRFIEMAGDGYSEIRELQGPPPKA